MERTRRGLSLLASPAGVTVVGAAEVWPAATASGFTGSFAGPLAPDTAWRQALAAAVERRVESGEVGPLLRHPAGELAADVVVVGSRARAGSAPTRRSEPGERSVRAAGGSAAWPPRPAASGDLVEAVDGGQQYPPAVPAPTVRHARAAAGRRPVGSSRR